VAPDYVDNGKAFVIRVRAEREQFVLAAESAESMLEWVEGLNQGIDISAPLEVRQMPGYWSLRRLSQQSSDGDGCDGEAR
jgi:hypothetical protein